MLVASSFLFIVLSCPFSSTPKLHIQPRAKGIKKRRYLLDISMADVFLVF